MAQNEQTTEEHSTLKQQVVRRAKIGLLENKLRVINHKNKQY